MSKLVSTESGKIHRQAKVAEGIGSRAQDFKDESCTRDFTSCSVNISNSVRWTKDDDCSPSRVCGSLQYQDNRKKKKTYGSMSSSNRAILRVGGI